ncbi:hypothetical protein V1512DRAFT_259328 [Lipomyces arxii]|uniref:uncharacterized protein n=1 Tax=Lipomyces arxii TaxID=56418 RepID=UPI0034CD92E5
MAEQVEADMAKLSVTQSEDKPEQAEPSEQSLTDAAPVDTDAAPVDSVLDEHADPSELSEFDRLLYSYCDLMDQYQEAAGKMSRLFADGFFSLAQANYNSPLRFGQDYYHGSMTASKVIKIEKQSFTPSQNTDKTIKFANLTLVEVPLPKVDEPESESVPEEIKVVESTPGTTTATETSTVRRRKQDKKEPAPEPEKESGKESEKEPKVKDQAEEEKPAVVVKKRKPQIPLNRDPIRWFGVLVPRALRQSQTDFTSAVDEVAGVLSLINKISALEDEIIKVRKESIA